MKKRSETRREQVGWGDVTASVEGFQSPWDLLVTFHPKVTSYNATEQADAIWFVIVTSSNWCLPICFSLEETAIMNLRQ